MNLRKICVLAFVFFFSLFANSYTEEDISFSSDSLDLYGTLSIPDGTGPFPVCILIHGSGPADKDGTVIMSGGNTDCLFPDLVGDTLRTFKDLANALSSNDIAVLRYDKRSNTHGSSLDIKSLSPYDFIIDINSAVDFIKTRDEIDTNRIILIGHSQGCNFIPIVARQRNDISSLVSLACLARPIDSVVAEQTRYIFQTCADSTQGQYYYELYLNIFQQVREGTWDPNTPIDGAYPKFWSDWIDITDSATINYNLINQPSFFLQGVEDFQVTVEDASLLRDSITRDSISVIIMDSLTHFFTTLSNPKFEQSAIDTIIAWLRETEQISIEDYDFNSIKNYQISVFPNPFNPTTTIIFPAYQGKTDLYIYNIAGEKVFEHKNIKTNKITWSAEGLSSGSYIVKLCVDNKVLRKRISFIK